MLLLDITYAAQKVDTVHKAVPNTVLKIVFPNELATFLCEKAKAYASSVNPFGRILIPDVTVLLTESISTVQKG
jgi:hypothetical protein